MHSRQWRVKGFLSFGWWFFNCSMRLPHRIKADLNPTEVGAELKKFEISNTVDSRKMHSTRQICNCISLVSHVCVASMWK